LFDLNLFLSIQTVRIGHSTPDRSERDKEIMMAAVMDLDLNCSPPSPEPAAQDDLNRSMLRHQVRVQTLPFPPPAYGFNSMRPSYVLEYSRKERFL
jgi:hypothetical protein